MFQPAGILKHSQTSRFHPILFRPAPSHMDEDDGPKRHRSRGHHPLGFESIEEANTHIEENGWNNSGLVWLWDDDGTIPAMTEWFSQPETFSGQV
jgi:hypothetical protein